MEKKKNRKTPGKKGHRGQPEARDGSWKPRIPAGGQTNVPLVGQALLGARQDEDEAVDMLFPALGAAAAKAAAKAEGEGDSARSRYHEDNNLVAWLGSTMSFEEEEEEEEEKKKKIELAEKEEHEEEEDIIVAALGSAGDEDVVDPYKRKRIAMRHHQSAQARILGIRRHDGKVYREANLGQALGMPPLVFINVPECDANSAIASVVRRAAMRHGLRGANTGTDETLAAVRAAPIGTPAVIADGVSMKDLLSLQKGGQMDGYPYTFTLLDDPLERAVAAFVHHGMSQSGWKGTKKNLVNFLLGGKSSSSLGAFANFHRANFLTRRVASQDEIAKIDSGKPLTDEDVVRVLDRYNLVGTREKLNETLVFLKLSVPTLELRDVIQVPANAYAASDPFGFATADHMGRQEALDPEARAWIQSDEFKKRFEQINAADYALYNAATRRLQDRIKNSGPIFGRHVWWMNALNEWLQKRMAVEPAFVEAAQMPRATSQAMPCPEGREAECARRILSPGVGNHAIAAQARRHAGQECLFLNQGCFAQLVIDITLAEFKRNAARKVDGLVSPVTMRNTVGGLGLANDKGGGSAGGVGVNQNQAARVMSGELEEESVEPRPQAPAEMVTKLVRNMALCAKTAELEKFNTCKDASTFGWGLSGKRIVAGTQRVYVLCHKEECDSVCVPEMWAKKTTVLDGGRTDACLGLEKVNGAYVDHWHRASLLHAAAIEHARSAGYAPVAIVEADAVFVEAENEAVAAGAESSIGMDSFLSKTGKLGRVANGGLMEDLANFGDLGHQQGQLRFARGGGETTRLKAMLSSTRWTEEDERALLDLVSSGTFEATAAVSASKAGAGAGAGAAAVKPTGGGAGAAGAVGVSSSNAGRWTLIRLGYRPMDFENGVKSCPAHCGCWHKPGVRRWCTVHTYSCDMRAAHAYIVSAQAYPLMLAEILGTPGYGVIDAGTMQRIPQQVFTTPMLAVQKQAQADLITPTQQLAHAKLFGRGCGTGNFGAGAGTEGVEGPGEVEKVREEMFTRHAYRELSQYLPTAAAAAA